MNKHSLLQAMAQIAAAVAAALPFIVALFCPETKMDAAFMIVSGRPLCQCGVIGSILLLMVSALFWEVLRRSTAQQGAFPAPPNSSARNTSISLALSLAVLSAFTVYLFVFTLSSNSGLLSADQDVTNVSTAIARTTLTDILPTPYVAAGASRSFLAHHFSPSLLLYTPLYRIAMLFSNANHNFYNIVLFLTLVGGMALWLYYAYRLLPALRPFLPVVLIPLLHSFLLFRQILSFHFEVLTLPLMALLLLSLRLQGRKDLPPRAVFLQRSWPIVATLFLGIKEDMGAYLGLFAGVHFVFEIIDAYRERPASLSALVLDRLKGSVYFRLGLLAVLWTATAMIARILIAGDGAPNWESYWNVQDYVERFPQFRKTPYTYIWILLSSGIWIFFSLRSTVLVLLILSFHMISGMPWHALLESHYSYTVLPFLFSGSLRGLSNIAKRAETNQAKTASLLLPLFVGPIISDYALLRDRNHPYAPFAQHPAYAAVEEIVKQIPADACVQSSFHLSALVPLRARPIPFTFYEGSPFEQSMPGGARLHVYDVEKGECKVLYRLFYGHLAGELKNEMDREGTIVAETKGLVLLWKWDQ